MWRYKSVAISSSLVSGQGAVVKRGSQSPNDCTQQRRLDPPITLQSRPPGPLYCREAWVTSQPQWDEGNLTSCSSQNYNNHCCYFTEPVYRDTFM